MRPDDPEVREWIGGSMVAQVATLSRKGVPALTPLWFASDRGRLYLGTGRATLAVRNISAQPGVVLLFHAERRGAADRVLSITGAATWHDGFPSWRVIVRLVMKYYLSPGGLRSELAHMGKWGLRQRYYAQGQAAVIEVVPEAAEFVPNVA